MLLERAISAPHFDESLDGESARSACWYAIYPTTRCRQFLTIDHDTGLLGRVYTAQYDLGAVGSPTHYDLTFRHYLCLYFIDTEVTNINASDKFAQNFALHVA